MLDDLLDWMTEIPDCYREGQFKKRELPKYKELAMRFLEAVKEGRLDEADILYAALGNDAWHEQGKLPKGAGDERRQFYRKYMKIFGMPYLRLRKEIDSIYREFHRPAVLSYTFSKAERAFSDGKYEEAEQMYIPFSMDDPDKDERALTAVMRRAECKRRIGSEDEARSYLLDTIEKWMKKNGQAYVERILDEWPELRREAMQYITAGQNGEAPAGSCVLFGSYLYWDCCVEEIGTPEEDYGVKWRYIYEEPDKAGIYEINSGNGYVGSIRWRVMEQRGDSALLVSDRLLDLRPFYENADPDREKMDWRGSDIRRWLNGEFYDSAFSDSEKEQILPTDPDSAIREPLSAGNETGDTDRVFLLGTEELEKYYPLGPLQLTRIDSTDFVKYLHHYARNELEYLGDRERYDGKMWLRPALDNTWGVPFLKPDGKVNEEYNTDKLVQYCGVLPAIWVAWKK